MGGSQIDKFNTVRGNPHICGLSWEHIREAVNPAGVSGTGGAASQEMWCLSLNVEDRFLP